MKNILFLILFSSANLFSQAQEINKSILKPIKQLEKSFTKGNIKYVKPYLATNFKIDDTPEMLSNMFLGSMINSKNIKGLGDIKLLSKNGDTVFVTCNFMFDEPENYKIRLIKNTNNYLIEKIYMGIKTQMVTQEVNSIDELKDPNNYKIERSIDLSKFNIIDTNQIRTYYPSVNYKKEAEEVNNTQQKIINDIEKVFGTPLKVKMGIALVYDSVLSLDVNDFVLPLQMTIKSESDYSLYWVYVHESTEFNLVTMGISDPNTRWFRDGLAEYVSQKSSKQLNINVYNERMAEHVERYKTIKGKADLLNWVGTGANTVSVDYEADPPKYSAAMYFFIDLANEFGENTITQLIQSLDKTHNITSEEIIKKLSKITNTDIKERLKKY